MTDEELDKFVQGTLGVAYNLMDEQSAQLKEEWPRLKDAIMRNYGDNAYWAFQDWQAEELDKLDEDDGDG